MALRLPSFLCAASAGLILTSARASSSSCISRFALRFRVGFEEFGFSALAFLGLMLLIIGMEFVGKSIYRCREIT